MNLELMGLRWLRWEKRCWLALYERSPRYGHGIPDVLGVMPSRHLIEIEVKRSMADFRADAKKIHRINRIFNLTIYPRQFYYLMPRKLAEKAGSELPLWAGLMAAGEEDYSLTVVHPAPVNGEAKRLTVKECCRLAMLVGNHLVAAEESKHVILTRQLATCDPYHWSYDI